MAMASPGTVILCRRMRVRESFWKDFRKRMSAGSSLIMHLMAGTEWTVWITGMWILSLRDILMGDRYGCPLSAGYMLLMSVFSRDGKKDYIIPRMKRRC